MRPPEATQVCTDSPALDGIDYDLDYLLLVACQLPCVPEVVDSVAHLNELRDVHEACIKLPVSHELNTHTNNACSTQDHKAIDSPIDLVRTQLHWERVLELIEDARHRLVGTLLRGAASNKMHSQGED